MAKLVLIIREGADAGREVPLASETTIGRDEAVDLVLSDAGISRTHAKVTPEGMSAVIEDLGSSNGTFVNGERVEDPRRLRDGDELQLGNAILAFAAGTDETELVEPVDPDATEAHPGPAAIAAAAAAAGGAGAEAAQPPPTAQPPPPAQPPPTAALPPEQAPVEAAGGDKPWDSIPMPKPKKRPPKPARPKPRHEPFSQADPDVQGDSINDWNLPAWGAFILGPLSIALLIFSSGSGFYAALPIAVTAIALGTIGRNKVNRAETVKYGGIAMFGRTFGIIGTILAALILLAVIAINQFLDVSAESIGDLIDEIRIELESN